MKTKVDGLLIVDENGIKHCISSRCPNGDLKRRYIKGLIRDGLLRPTEGVVTLLGEVLAENERLVSELKEADRNIEAAAVIIDDQYETLKCTRDLAQTLVALTDNLDETDDND